jgi:hypothetical protein
MVEEEKAEKRYAINSDKNVVEASLFGVCV